MTNLRQHLVRSCAEEGVKHYPPQAFVADLTRADAMSIAWDEAAECLARRDAAGFDAAMRIFKHLREAGVSNKAPVSNSNVG